jgi:arylsulfatase A-like enzyme
LLLGTWDAPGAQPNILLIVSEDHGPELGCYGDPYARTPHLDRLAAEGVLFQRAYVTQAGCSQSRSSILTGLYPHQNGQIGLATWGFRMYCDQTPNVPRSLKAAGYRTGIIGKLHVNPHSAFPYDVQEIPRGNFARNDLADYARHAESFFQADDRPFFLHINYPEAHDPFLTQVDGLPEHPLTAADVRSLPHFGIDPPELRQLVADYYNCISRLDSLIGDLLAALDRSGKADKTLVIFLSDHGIDLLRGKRTCYEGGTRVPLIVHWPGKACASNPYGIGLDHRSDAHAAGGRRRGAGAGSARPVAGAVIGRRAARVAESSVHRVPYPRHRGEFLPAARRARRAVQADREPVARRVPSGHRQDLLGAAVRRSGDCRGASVDTHRLSTPATAAALRAVRSADRSLRVPGLDRFGRTCCGLCGLEATSCPMA